MGAEKVFFEYNQPAVIIIEDDLALAPDFFEYFQATLPILKSDPTLWCVSAWNDMGQEKFVRDPTALRRTNFFPGLGWMLTKELWTELSPKWPAGYWDDWMREPANRKGRDCIHPEISRSYTFGRKGSSGGQFFDQHLSGIKLNDKFVKFTESDLTYLLKPQWDRNFKQLIEPRSFVAISSPAEIEQHSNARLALYYSSLSQYSALASQLGLHSDLKAGVPRTSYQGVVHVYINTNQVWLIPQDLKSSS